MQLSFRVLSKEWSRGKRNECCRPSRSTTKNAVADYGHIALTLPEVPLQRQYFERSPLLPPLTSRGMVQLPMISVNYDMDPSMLHSEDATER